MPYLHLTLSTTVAESTTQQVAELLTELTATILRKKRELTAVRVEFGHPPHWTIGGKALTGQAVGSFYLEVKVTDGTNTPEEKSRFIAQVFAGLELLLGPLAPASYTVIHAVPPENWGYQGRTQVSRMRTLVHTAPSTAHPAP